jgi:hypothetical protein
MFVRTVVPSSRRGIAVGCDLTRDNGLRALMTMNLISRLASVFAKQAASRRDRRPDAGYSSWKSSYMLYSQVAVSTLAKRSYGQSNPERSHWRSLERLEA